MATAALESMGAVLLFNVQIFDEAIKAGLAHKASGADFVDEALTLMGH